jgi:hypothetical protein
MAKRDIIFRDNLIFARNLNSNIGKPSEKPGVLR